MILKNSDNTESVMVPSYLDQDEHVVRAVGPYIQDGIHQPAEPHRRALYAVVSHCQVASSNRPFSQPPTLHGKNTCRPLGCIVQHAFVAVFCFLVFVAFILCIGTSLAAGEWAWHECQDASSPATWLRPSTHATPICSRIK